MASIGRTNLSIGKSESEQKPEPTPRPTPEELISRDVKAGAADGSDHWDTIQYRMEGSRLIARTQRSGGDEFYGQSFRFYEVEVTVKEIDPAEARQ